MKRRNFLKLMGMSFPTVATGKNLLMHNLNDASFRYQYPEIRSLDDVLTKENEVLVRIKFTSRNEKAPALSKGDIRVDNAELVNVSSYNFEAPRDLFDPETNAYELSSVKNRPDILMLRLSKASENTQITIRHNQENLDFRLKDILEKGYLQFSPEHAQIDVNFLLDKEIGEIDPSEVGIQGDPENFSFHILADTQGGDPGLPSNVPTRMKIHNAFLEDSINLSNKMPERPVFSLILGDVVDSQGEKGNFQTMHRYLSRLKSPVLYELGNHESKYSSKFEPGYKMDALNNYFAAQKKMNGLTKLLYSFNLGRWHFVVWPDPLRSHFWDNHPHYFEWLEKDLEKHKNRPTIMFQHVPIHPIGISPFMSYLESPTVRKRVMEIVTRYGNVKYVFSGHTHTTAKASFKTAFSIKGTRFINFPAAGYRPRGFGEQDYYGGPTQGIGIVNIQGDKAEVIYKTVMEEEFKYPQNPPELDREKYRLWFNNKWEIKANPKLMNGSFARGLDHWAPEFVYAEDKDPSSVCKAVRKDGTNSLYLYNRKRGYDAPGQDRLPQTINRIAQVVQHKPGQYPMLQFKYKIDKDHTDLNGYCGAFVWLEGYEGEFRRFNLVYSAGMAYVNPVGKGSDRVYPVHHFNLPPHEDWANVTINPGKDFNRREEERKFGDLRIDRLVINLGVWHMNEGEEQPFGIYFTGFDLQSTNRLDTVTSRVNGSEIVKKKEEEVWWRGKHVPFTHLAGEHRYHLATTDKVLFRRE